LTKEGQALVLDHIQELNREYYSKRS